jgi:hypothetical protein
MSDLLARARGETGKERRACAGHAVQEERTSMHGAKSIGIVKSSAIEV